MLKSMRDEMTFFSEQVLRSDVKVLKENMQLALKKIVNGTPFKVFGSAAVMKLADGNTCQIHLSDTGRSSSHFAEISALVVDTSKKVVVRNNFSFSHYLKRRLDKRPDYKDGFYIWDEGGSADWYIAIPDPAEVKHMVLDIVKWAEHFG